MKLNKEIVKVIKQQNVNPSLSTAKSEQRNRKIVHNKIKHKTDNYFQQQM